MSFNMDRVLGCGTAISVYNVFPDVSEILAVSIFRISQAPRAFNSEGSRLEAVSSTIQMSKDDKKYEVVTPCRFRQGRRYP